MNNKDKPRVSILSGGLSSEDYLSRRSCQLVFDFLEDGPFGLDVLDWNKDGSVDKLSRPNGRKLIQWPSLQKCFNEHKADAVFNCLHGEKEIAGQLQGFFTILDIPFTGNEMAPSVIGMDKMLSKDLFRRLGILTPRDFFLGYLRTMIPLNSLKDINMYGLDFPFIIKATHGGSSEGVALIENPEDFIRIHREWQANQSIKYCPVFAEEFIDGEEYCLGVFGHWSHETLSTLPLAKIIFPGKIFDKTVKFNNNYSSEFGNQPPVHLSRLMEDAGKDVHRSLKFTGFSRMDFIIKDNFQVYAIEVNTHPGLSPNSIIPSMVSNSRDFSLKEALVQMINWSIKGVSD